MMERLQKYMNTFSRQVPSMPGLEFAVDEHGKSCSCMDRFPLEKHLQDVIFPSNRPGGGV
jgi:hypothetical protein